jgi:hypothetical protein
MSCRSFLLCPFSTPDNIAAKQNMRVLEKSIRQTKTRNSDLRANSTRIGEMVEGTFLLRGRFFGSWFSKLGCAGIFDIVPFPLAPIQKSGKRRRYGVGRFRMLL